ncbi:MAG: gfo/Idh/MocA family oxidoreductase, partial [Gammaproteobacteria bacterium]|nr:gfo/Idh/MocA family oxidoreductase [Gammaproteobacteria bacterium]
SSVVVASDSTGPNTATVVGHEGRIMLDSVWFRPTTFRVIDNQGNVVEEFRSPVSGYGRQHQAEEVERLIRSGNIAGDVMPPDESLAIMRTLDAIRARIGLRYPAE